MSLFDNIKNIKSKFEDNLKDINEFEHSNGLLKDFGNYLEKNKGMLIGIVGIALINIASQASIPIINRIS
jgi:hypothetical protein